jgi:glutamate-ammonia-ligase adenylyltransferase
VLDPRLYDVATDWNGFAANCSSASNMPATPNARWTSCARRTTRRFSACWRRTSPACRPSSGSPTTSRNWPTSSCKTTLDLCWAKLKDRHPHPEQPPKFAVIAYGKLGGKELGYGSDLDLVFLHDDPEPGYRRALRPPRPAHEHLDVEPDLGRHALRNRPAPAPERRRRACWSVDRGLPRVPAEKAWAWEHQALTRARFCAGDPDVGARFEAIRIEILRQPRDLAKLKEEVLAMRQRMLDSHASNSEEFFDIKQDPAA